MGSHLYSCHLSCIILPCALACTPRACSRMARLGCSPPRTYPGHCRCPAASKSLTGEQCRSLQKCKGGRSAEAFTLQIGAATCSLGFASLQVLPWMHSGPAQESGREEGKSSCRSGHAGEMMKYFAPRSLMSRTADSRRCPARAATVICMSMKLPLPTCHICPRKEYHPCHCSGSLLALPRAGVSPAGRFMQKNCGDLVNKDTPEEKAIGVKRNFS